MLTRLPSTAQPQASYSNATSTDATPVPTPDTSRPTTPVVNHLLSSKAGPGGRGSRRARKAITSANASSGDETSSRRPRAVKTESKKKMRRWDADGPADEGDEVPLDYSANKNIDGNVDSETRLGTIEAIAQESWGSRTGKGEFILRDLDDEVHSILQGADAKQTKKSGSTGVVGSSLGAIGGLFRNVIGGKVLTKEDLEKSMKGMEEHLLKKNVAREAAVRLCEGVERELIGVKTGSFESTQLYTLLPSFPYSILTKAPTSSRRNRHPQRHGILPPQNPNPNNIPRPPPRNPVRHRPFPAQPPPTPPPLRHLRCRRQRRR